ncbi:alpha/beta fold hydrolase [Spirosoma flavum]|uniref:Alpha/beta fold hydrolase n=1 Tax=Spirosoma flavum TaxID=2048557 RepID=A0ABW6AMJ3_9BACT
MVINQYGTDASVQRFDTARVTLPQFVEDIERLRKALGYSSFTLLGHSWGGSLAMAYVKTYPKIIQVLPPYKGGLVDGVV